MVKNNFANNFGLMLLVSLIFIVGCSEDPVGKENNSNNGNTPVTEDQADNNDNDDHKSDLGNHISFFSVDKVFIDEEDAEEVDNKLFDFDIFEDGIFDEKTFMEHEDMWSTSFLLL